MAKEDDFLLGVLVALQVVAAHDDPVIGVDIAKSVGVDDLRRLAKGQGGIDTNTMKWIDRNL